MPKNKNEKIFIWGAGGHGRSLLDIFRKNNEFEVAYFVDDNPKIKDRFVDGVKIISGKDAVEELKKKNIKKGIVGIGECKKRCEIFEILESEGFSFVNAIDPTAIISSTAEIGKGTTIWAGSIIGTHAAIGSNVIVNDGSIVGHDSIIGFGAHISAGVRLVGGIEIGQKTFIGLGAVVFCRKIGKNSMVGAGSVVSQDIGDGLIAVGFPARTVGKRN